MKQNGRAEPQRVHKSIKRIGIYARVSNIERQTGEDKVSIRDQLSDSRTLAKKLGVVVGEYVDDERYRVGTKLVDPSGWRVDRPAWLRLFADVRAGKIDLIIAWRMDRLVRSLKATALLDDLLDDTGVDVALFHGVFDKSRLGFDAAISRHELTVLKERTDMGRRSRVRRGLRASDKVPFGYRVIKDTLGKTTGYELKKSHAPILLEMGRLFAAGCSYREIAERMGINPDSGTPWLSGQVWKMVHNTFYHGRLEYQAGGATGHGQYELPWNEKLRSRVLAEISRRSKLRPFAPRSREAPLAGLLFCSYCGGPMHGVGGSDARFYRCARRHNYMQRSSNIVCDHPNNQIAEQAALDQIQDMLTRLTPAEIDAYLATVQPAAIDSERVAWLTAQLSELDARLSQLESGLGLDLPEAARAAIAGEATKLQGLRDALADELEKAKSTVGPDLESVHEAMLELVSDAGRLHRIPLNQLRERLRAAFPALCVLHGRLSFRKTVTTP